MSKWANREPPPRGPLADAGAGTGPIRVVGNPENRRVRMFCDAARRLGQEPPQVLSYESLLAGQCCLRSAVQPGCILRLESPGEDERVWQGLLALGTAGRTADGLGEPPEFGRIGHSQDWYRGFAGLLGAWQEALRPFSVRWMNAPDQICLAFDKSRCQELLEQRGIPVPRRLGTAHGYDELRARMRGAGQRRVFVKLAHGSSASGVVAFRAAGGRVCAITSVEMVRDSGRVKLYNSLRVREYRDEREVAELFDALCPMGVHVEAWLPKAGWSGRTFDLRVVVIAGQVRHMVMRTSQSPITNLHLGNRRGDAAGLLDRLPGASRDGALDACRRAAGVFDRSLYVGLDVMFTPGLRRHAVLEVNAFGDLLPGVLDRGEDTYTAEIRALPALIR